jgi:hypothetical protein
MPREIAIAAGAGLVASLFYLSVLTGSPGALILVYLTQLPLFLAGLSLGVKASVIAGAAGGAVSLVGGGIASPLFFLAVNAAPVVFLVRQALLWRRDPAGAIWWYPPGRLVLCLVGLAVAAVAAAAVFLAGAEGGVEGGVRSAIGDALGRLLAEPDSGSLEPFVTLVARFFPALAALSWMIMTTANGILAQGLLARFNHNRRPSPEMAEIELPSWAPAALAAPALVAALADGAAGYLGFNVAIVVAVAFLFAGLAVVHAAARRFGAGGAVLTGVYAVMIVFGWPIIVVAALGFIEQWAGLRRRLAPAATGPGR